MASGAGRLALLCGQRIFGRLPDPAFHSAPQARTTFLEGLDDLEPEVRKQALKGLNGLATVGDIEPLKRVMREAHWEHAQWAVETLASIGDRGLEVIHKMALAERDPAAAQYLARQGDPKGRDILAALLSEGGKRREAAAEYLRELRDERCIPYFSEQLETITHWRGAFMAHELGQIGAPQAVAVLVKALSRGTTHVRRGAVRGLWEAKDPASIEPLIRCFYDEDRKVRRLAADALSHFGEPAARALESALGEERIQGKSQQQMARDVLARIRGE